MPLTKPNLTIKQILAWADDHYMNTGRWPITASGTILNAPHEVWRRINTALERGLCGLPGASSLAKLLAEQRDAQYGIHAPRLTTKQVLAWADAHHKRTGKWPKQTSGAVEGTRGENWASISNCLAYGFRGLGGGPLAKLLYVERGVISLAFQQDLTVARICAWARAHHRRTGKWPASNAGPIAGEAGENWQKMDSALRYGRRGLPGGSSLSKVLFASRRSPRRKIARPLTVQHVLRWADDHRQRIGRWPTSQSGTVHEAPSENWAALDAALRAGLRGLASGSSLAKLLARRRRAPAGNKRKLSVQKILAWADKYHARKKRWPIQNCGNLPGVRNMNWRKIDVALRLGLRGLSGGSSLSRLLDQHRGVRNRKGAPALTLRNILAWADAHHRRTGAWPKTKSGPVREAPVENWSAINSALRQGVRGLNGGSSLIKLFAARRGARNPRDLPKLTVEQILSWANRHFECTGRWPTYKSGRVVGASDESWRGINETLCRGSRQLPGQTSLARLLKEHRHKSAR